MNSSSNQLISTLGHRLGLTNKSFSKAGELQRLLHMRGVNGLSSSAEAVICLQLAATVTGETSDKAAGVKLSGLTAPKFRAQLQTIGQMLGVSQRITIHDLAVTHSVLAAENLAKESLASYAKQSFGIDMQLPLYQTAALLAACKVLKLKPDKKKLVEISGAQKKVFDNTVVILSETASKLHETNEIEKTNVKGRSLASMIHDSVVKEDLAPSLSRKLTSQDQQDTEDDYEDWKRKILLEAQQ